MEILRNIRIVIITLILMQLFLVSCIQRKPIPTDEEMTVHFLANEATFCELRDSLLSLQNGWYYPSFYRDKKEFQSEYKNELEENCDSTIPVYKQQRLDSMLKVIGCERVYYTNPKMIRESRPVKLTFHYWSRGYSIGGTGKNYVYCPELPKMITKWCQGLVEGKETEQVIDEIAYEDTTIYRHITGDWYIQLEHDR